MRWLYLLIACLLGSSVVLVSCIEESNKDATDKLNDEKVNLDDALLSDIMKDFGKEINNMITGEVDRLVEDVSKDKKPSAHVDDLERLKNTNKILSKDTQEIIEMAGKKNDGELTQSGLMGNSEAGKNLLEQVGSRLHTAGSFIRHQLTSLSGFAPKLSGKLAIVPNQIRKIMEWPSFLKYKIRFNKVYKGLREEVYRQMIYLKTQAIVGIQNLKFLCGRVKHLLKATQFADWTDKEYKNIFDNAQAETPQNAPDIKKMSPSQKQMLANLAKKGATIFGKSAPSAGPTAPNLYNIDEDAKLNRRKRDDSELDEDEDDFIPLPRNPKVNKMSSTDDDEEFKDSLDHFEEDTSSSDESLKNQLDDSKAVDDFSAQFDDNAGSLDGLDDIIDSALEEKDSFEPIDLRKTGCILEPENQDSCGACYAYVTMSAASYYNCINSEKRDLVRYNTRFLSDCGRYISPPDQERPKVNGCRGGRVSHAIKFVDLAGTYEFMDYEFARRGLSFRDDKCVYPRPDSLDHWQPQPNIPPILVPSYHGVYYASLQMDEIDLHLRTVGPVFVNIRVWDGFRSYASGIVDSFKEGADTVIHSMLIVGHDKDSKGRDYYIIWNSHGTSWGENGFARVYSKSLEYLKIYIGGLMPETGEE